MLANAKQIILKMLEISDQKELSELIDGIQQGIYQYLLTLDMGCGNTSGAIGTIDANGITASINWKYKNLGSDNEWKDVLDLSIPTLIGYRDQEAIIGPEALRYGRAAENFKCLPIEQLLDEPSGAIGDSGVVNVRQAWEDYFRVAFDSALSDASSRVPAPTPCKENVIFVVAYPSSKEWEHNLGTYKKMICNATGLKKSQVVTFSEAKACMQYVRVYKQYPIDWKKGVVVIDLGASTVDVEYLAYNLEEPQKDQANKKRIPPEYSITMAGRNVDQLLGHYILKQAFPSEMTDLDADKLPGEDFFTKHRRELQVGNSRAFSYRIRQLKENICTSMKPVSFPVKMNGMNHDITIDPEKLQYILNSMPFSFVCYNTDIANTMYDDKDRAGLSVSSTWYGHLKRVVRYLFNEISNRKHSIDTIIVTGGSANLVGIQDLILAVAQESGVGNVKFVVMNEAYDYEKTVPYGSMSYIRNVIGNINHILDFPKELADCLKQDILANVPKEIHNFIYPFIDRKINVQLDRWGDLPEGDPDSTLNAMVRMVQQIFVDYQAQIDQEISKAFADINWVDADMFPATEAAIIAFLKKLSMDGSYSYKFNLRKVNCTVSPQTFRNSIAKSIPDVDWDLFKHAKWYYTFHDHDCLIPKKRGFYRRFRNKDSVRMVVKKNIQEVRPFKNNLIPPIKDSLEAEYDSRNGFGLMNQVMSNLEIDINQAMFLG